MRCVAPPAPWAYARQMLRLLALLLLTLSLAVASGPASAVPSVSCPMSASSPMSDNHDEMDCCAVTCASECAAVCPSGVMPRMGAAPLTSSTQKPDTPRPADALRSAERVGTDPPPRTTFS